MVRLKTSASKKPKRAGGVDFKKIKHKIGRKLPPPKNATNTLVKSKAIVLPEQSVVSERSGLAVSSRGLTLREELQRTSHPSAKTRKDALTRIRDLLLKNPLELKLHKFIIMEKLRERMCDNDKAVRETLYHLLKTVIFPRIKEEFTGPVIPSIMAYVFNAMTDLALDIRLMAFKFFHLIVLNCPSSFSLYAEKVLDCYGDIMRNMQLYLEHKSKIKDILGGLLHCLSFALIKERVGPQHGEGNATWRPLHAFGSGPPKEHTGFSFIMKKLEELLPLLINCFQEFMFAVHGMPTIDAPSFNCMLCILQIINLAVGFSVAEKDQLHRSSRVSVPSLFKCPDTVNMNICACLRKLWEMFPTRSMHQSMEKDDNKYFILNIRITEIFFQLSELMDYTEVLREKFLEFIEIALCGQICSNTQSCMAIQEKYLVSVIEFIPGLVSIMTGHWKVRLLMAFTSAFQNCRVDSRLMSACLSALMDMLIPRGTTLLFDINSQEMLCYQVVWLCKLPELLLRLGDKHPSLSKVILELLLRIGQCSVHQSPLALEYDKLQFSLREFYRTYDDLGVSHYGPFVKLPIDCQEIAICCLYYFSTLHLPLLEALTFCCLCNDLERIVPLRIIEVLHSVYKSGCLKLADYIGFLVTVVARFKVFPERFCSGNEKIGKVSNYGHFKAVTEAVFSCLSEIGDHSLLLKILEKTVFEEMNLKPHLENMHGILRMIVLLDSKPSVFLLEASSTLGQFIFAYLIDASYYMPEDINVPVHNEDIHIYQIYVRPCISLFLRSDKLLYEVLKSFSSHLSAKNDFESSEVDIVASTITFMLKDVKLHHHLSSSKEAIKNILQNIYGFLYKNRNNMALEKRHKMQSVFYQLKTEASKLQGWDNVDMTAFEVS
uniref:Testis-expressed sequence 10 n=1 Tax=Anthurium amnicola TaxID=1678845 RepID=A0A1D1Z3Z9_9ARAE